MKKLAGFLLLVGLSSGVYAGTPFTPQSFHAAQVNGGKILLAVHADWCPICRVQKNALSQLEKDGALKDITVFDVDFDKDTEFRKTVRVNEQATLIAFYGLAETGRVTGITSEPEIKAFLDKTLRTVSLDEQLSRTRATAGNLPPEKRKIMEAAADKLRASRLTEKALNVGKTMPAFALPNAQGKTVRLDDLLKQGPVIVSFYRGSWCPYCNAQLNSYQEHIAEFRQLGANLVAITPEKPDLTSVTSERKKLDFEILTDQDNTFAKKLGLVYGVTGELQALYKQWGIDLEKSQGNQEWQLPVPATYVVAKSGKIVYAFVNIDYTQRANPQDILQALKRL